MTILDEIGEIFINGIDTFVPHPIKGALAVEALGESDGAALVEALGDSDGDALGEVR